MQKAKERFEQYLWRRFGDRSTPKHYMSDLHLFTQFLEDKAPQAVTTQDVSRFVDNQQERGLQASTINRRLAAIHTFFEYLAGETPDEPWPNPVNWRLHSLRPGHRLPRDASDETIQRLFAAIDNRQDQALFGLMVGAGLRVGEVVQLRLGDFRAVAEANGMTRLRVLGKGQKERLVWLTPYWTAIVAAWVASRPTGSLDYLFLNQHQQPLSVAGVQFRLGRYCQTAGVVVSCHQLRHTFARRLAEQGMPLEGIAKLLGHNQLETTQRYTAGADPQLRAEFLQAMSGLPDPTEPPTAPVERPLPLTRQAEVADRAQLEAIMAGFNDLPAWLQPQLAAYVRRRWYQWQPHLAGQHAQRLVRQLLAIWQAIVRQRPLHDWPDLKRSDLERWLDDRTQANLAASTRRNELTTLLSFLRFVLDQGLPLSANLFRLAYPQPPQSLPRSLTPTDYHRLCQSVDAQTSADTAPNRLDRAWFATLSQTGLRLNELLNLRLSDLDLSGRRLLIRGGKNGFERLVFLTPTVRQTLLAYLEQRPPGPDDHLWLSEGQPLLDHQVRYRLRTWGQQCQVAVTPHQLRHTFATLLVNNGLPLATIAKLLGHRSLTMTQHYARLFDTTLQRQFQAAMEQIEGIPAPDWPIPADYSVIKVQTV